MALLIPKGGAYLQPTRSSRILFNTAPPMLPKYLVQRVPTASPILTGKNEVQIPPSDNVPVTDPPAASTPDVPTLPTTDAPAPPTTDALAPPATDRPPKARKPTYLIAGAATTAKLSSALIDVFGIRTPKTYHAVDISFETTDEDFRGQFTEEITALTLSSSRMHPRLQVATVTFATTPPSLEGVSILGFTEHPLGQFWKGSDLILKDDCGRTVFSRAAVNGNLDLTRALAQFPSVDVNTQDNNGRTPLHLACMHQHNEVLQLLLVVPGLDAGLQSNARETAYDMARKNKDETIGLQFLLNVFTMNETDPHDALARQLTMSTEPYHPNAPPRNPKDLWDAAEAGHVPLVKALIFADVDVNAVNAEQVTGLGLAAIGGYPEVVQALLAAPGIDVNRADVRGFTPLHHACGGGVADNLIPDDGKDWIGVVRLLIAAPGVNLSARTLAGQTPRQLAEGRGHVAAAGLLPL